tara:strand:- start:5088 stop:6347 length:1260 start_codon:yes stop_codon:yes gene_type:complete
MNNKILILGSNPETAALVEKAKQKNLITYVMGKEKKSMTKKIADFPIFGDASNVKFVKETIKKNNIGALLVGTVDSLIETYEKVCQEIDLPCYANKKSISAFSSKNRFNKICKKFGFKQLPDYTQYLKDKLNLPDSFYPVMIKPIDAGAGLGAKICYSNNELQLAIKNAKKNSKKKQFICQDYFLGDDIQLYYTIINKKAFLSCVIDRTTNKNQNNKSPVCIGANYNSKYLKLILRKFDKKFKKMINYLKILNGVLSIQCFVKNNELYPYDPGFRLQGEGQHLVLSKINKFDHLDMLLDLSLGKPFFSKNFKRFNDPYLDKRFVSSVWVLLKKGVINKIYNLDKIKKLKCFLNMTQRFNLNDKVKSSFIGTEKQVFARIYLASKVKKELINSISYIHKELKILDINNKSLILDKYERID